MIPRKSESDLEAMRPACRLARRILDEVCDFLKPGVTTGEVDAFAGRLIESYGARSAFLGYRDQKYKYYSQTFALPKFVRELGDEVLVK